MKYSIAVVSVFVATAFAIPQGGSPLDLIPKCAQTCALTNIGSSGCSITGDPSAIAACLCGKPAFQKAFADCVKKENSCSATEQCSLYTNSVAQCKAAGVDADIPKPDGSCGADSTPSSSPAAEPPAATSAPAEEPSTPAETTAPAATTAAPEPTTPATVPTGNGTAPSVPEASSPGYSNNAGTLAAKGGAAVLAVFVAVLAL